MIEVMIRDFGKDGKEDNPAVNPVLKIAYCDLVKLLDIIFKSGYDAMVRDPDFESVFKEEDK